jgi:hypothetical protein
MDFLILIHFSISCIIFFIAHILVFRSLKKNSIIAVLFAVYLAVAVLHLISAYLYAGYFPEIFKGDRVMQYLIYPWLSLVLYSLSVFSFILAVFGITVTSLRIQLLSEISKKGSRGMKQSEISGSYSNEKLLDTRIARLVDSGELILKNGRYYPGSHLSYFRIHTSALIYLNVLYNLKGYQKYRRL